MKRNRQKHGVAIEYAVMMLLVVFGFCTLFVTLMQIRTKEDAADSKLSIEYYQVCEIGEGFVRNPEKYNTGTCGDFILTVSNETTPEKKSLSVSRSNNKLLLEVVIQKSNDEWEVIAWKYHTYLS